jgi:hypothetical protein
MFLCLFRHRRITTSSPVFHFETNPFPNHQESSWLCSMTATEKEIFGSEFSPNTHKLPNFAIIYVYRAKA